VGARGGLRLDLDVLVQWLVARRTWGGDAVTTPASDPGLPVSRLVAPVIWRIGALVGVMAAICVVGIVLATQAVQDLTDEVDPVDTSHESLGKDVDRLSAAVLAFASRGDPQLRDAYADARTDYATSSARLREDAEGIDGLEDAVATELDAVERWVEEYADPVMAGPGGPTGVPPESIARGQDLLEPVSTSGAAVEDAVAERRESAADAAILRFRLTVAAAVLLVAVSWILIARARARLLGQLSEPLLALERVVHRMAKNDPEGRADTEHGPKEVRAVARALNDFADAQSRARAVEGRIRDELHVLDSAKDDFVSNVSHELRTPLTTISGYLELVSEEFEGTLEPRHERMLDATRRNVVRLRALIDDLLALSTVENRPTDLAASDVMAVVVDVVSDLRMSAARRGITIDLAGPDEPVPVVCDRPMLYRAFLNLVSNAVKFSHADGVVEIGVRLAGDRAEIAVRDRGIGIPHADLDRLGTRFFRASNATDNEIQGTGLGLRIVQTIIDKHAGDVVIESAEGEGTTVYVRLPVSRRLRPDVELESDTV
jgi:signal transduction histidine kinase